MLVEMINAKQQEKLLKMKTLNEVQIKCHVPGANRKILGVIKPRSSPRAPAARSRMSRLAFQTQLASIMEVLANAAVAEICKLVDDDYAVVSLQMSQCQRENKGLKREAPPAGAEDGPGKTRGAPRGGSGERH
ncbi:hypothetical protein F7725_005201 [Dissostichus mawsoni]|uniref:Uncharacterized protein n=1 Tax=Dissostichus mawsoni TaxID=36200 RepID=A0A7J5YQQ2_DISMA|nr:hypothetical protein F7725_005201 [Dissostichus mawsoni]